MKINLQRLLNNLDSLHEYGSTHDGGTSRLALTKEDKLGRDFVLSLFKSLNLEIKIDGIGNCFGIYKGTSNKAPFMIGSHIDTVSTGGKFDGNLGVLCGVEIIATLKDNDFIPERDIVVAFFTNEEGARFAPDMMGSLVFEGALSLQDALSTIGIDGTSVGENLEKIGYKGEFNGIDYVPEYFIELHVEQGPVLDKEHFDIGIVEGVQGIYWNEITIHGTSNHAGTTPMSYRKDPMLVACKLVTFIRELTKEYGANQIGTTGFMKPHPNLVNVIPSQVTFTIDIRNTDEQLLSKFKENVMDYLAVECEKEQVTFTTKELANFAPVQFSSEIINLIEEEIKMAKLNYKKLPSGAGHDAQILARRSKAGMIFIPSKDGISHNITEFSKDIDIENGANILLKIAQKLSKDSH